MTALLVLKEDVTDKPVRWPPRFVASRSLCQLPSRLAPAAAAPHRQLHCNALRCARQARIVRRLQVIVSLFLSSIMLGKQGTSLVAIVRTTNRKHELQMLVGELARARGSNTPQELVARARRATEYGEPGMELVRRPMPSTARFLLATAKRVCPAALLESTHSAPFRPQARNDRRAPLLRR
jgi:hypothetical protein